MKRIIVTLALVMALPCAWVSAEEKKTAFEVQALLSALGYNIGKVDGIVGAKTKDSLIQFRDTNDIDSGLKMDESTVLLLREKYFSKNNVPVNSNWNGNFILPLDILKKFNSVSDKRFNFLCRKDLDSSSGRLSKNLYKPVPLRLSGYNSRMDNRTNVPHAEQLSLATIDYSHLTVNAMSGISSGYTEDALKLLFYWARGGAFLDTVQCTNSGVLKKECTEWTQPDGQDISLSKDHGAVQMEMMHLAYGYYMSLINYNANDPRHAIIQQWFGEFFKRNKNFDSENLSFGADYGWSWPKILQNQLEGKSSVNLIDSLLNHINENVFEDGSIKNRTNRGNRALWYHNDGMKELLVTLEIARRHGFEVPDELHKKVEKAAELFLRGFKDHSYLDKWAVEAHNSIYEPGYQDFKNSITDMPNNNAWFYIFAYRYPKSKVTKELLSLIDKGQSEALGSKDGQIGFGLGCVYSAINDDISLPGPKHNISLTSFENVEINERPKGKSSATEIFQVLGIKLKNLSVDGEFIGNPRFSLLLDFKSHSYDDAKTFLFRLVFPKESLKPGTLLSVKNCNHISYHEENGQVENLRYMIGNGARHNACIVNLLKPGRVKLLETVVDTLPTIIERGLAHVPERREFFLQALENAQNQ